MSETALPTRPESSRMPTGRLPRFADIRLGTKLVAAFLLVALIPIAILFIVNNNNSRRSLTDTANANLQAASQTLSNDLDSFVKDNLSYLRTMGLSRVWSDYLALPAAQRPGSVEEQRAYAELNGMARRNTLFITSASLYDASGTDVADTSSAAIGQSRATRLFFTQPVKTGLPYASEVEIAAETGQYSLYFSAPVRDARGAIIGVLRIRYNELILQQIVSGKNGLAGSGSHAVVFDDYHIRLADGTSKQDLFLATGVLDQKTISLLQSTRRLPTDPAAKLSVNNPTLDTALSKYAAQPIFSGDLHGNGTTEQAAIASMTTEPWLVAYVVDQQTFLAPLGQSTAAAAALAGIIAVLVALLALLFAQSINRPIAALTQVAQKVSSGDLSVEARAASRDEIGILASAFNTMTTQLREMIGQLEQRVAERTKALNTSTAVSRRLSTILDRQQLVKEVVEQVKQAFNYYHAHIYFMDEASGDLIMAGGTGEAGATMLARGHKVPKGRGLVGRAAETNAPVLVPDTSSDPDWLPNPLLPETRSEIAVPISAGGKILGVLDVQNNAAGSLGQQDVDLLRSIADQVAIAVQNASLYDRAEAAIQEAQSLVDYAPEAIVIVDLETGCFTDPNENAVKLYGLPVPELVKVGPARMSPPRQPDGRDSTEKAMEKINDAMQGKFPVFDWTHRNAQGEDIPCEVRLVRLPGTHPRVRASVTDITERKRLEELTIRRARQQEAINLISQRIQSADTVEGALQIAARELGHALGGKPTAVTLESIAPSVPGQTDRSSESSAE